MAFLLGQLHFWTTKEETLSINSDVGCHSYHSKSSKITTVYSDELKSFTEDRGLVWSPGKKKPEKLRDSLKETEELFATFRCVYCTWCDRNCLLLMLNSGVIIIIRVKAGVGDIEKIQIDKFLVGKLHSDHIVDGNKKTECHVDPKLTCVQLSRKPVSENSSKKWEKLANLDAKVMHFDLMGPTGRRLERKLTCNVQKDQVLIWWMSRSDEVWPWTPISTDQDRANIHVYSINSGDLKLACCTRTKSDPVSVTYSHLHTYQFHTIEQKVSRKGEITVDVCIYEVLRSKIQQISVTTVLVNNLVVCHGMNETEDRILLGCKDGSLVMYDAHCKTTRLIKASIAPTAIRWHPSGSIVMIINEMNQLQCYDMALCCVSLQLLSDRLDPQKWIELSSYFKCQPSVQELAWNPEEYSPKDVYGYQDNSHSLLILVEKGPLVLFVLRVGVNGMGTLSPVDLVAQYIHHRQLDEAINLLLNLNWNIASDTCYKCLSLIANRLLKTKLTDENEVQLEMALGSFYSPSYPLSDVVLLEYGNKLRHLARRFFHHLLRHERFEKAFLLAADVGSRDLFMDIHYLALDKDERILAQAALDRARQLEQGSDSSSIDSNRIEQQSCSSSSSCSSYFDDDDSDRSFEKNDRAMQTRHDFDKLKVTPHQMQNTPPPTTVGQNVGWHRTSVQPSQTIPANQEHRTLHSHDQSELDTFEEDDEGHGLVHVVHFGIV